MNFKEINLKGKTVHISADLVQMIEQGEDDLAVITMFDGSIILQKTMMNYLSHRAFMSRIMVRVGLNNF